MFISWNDHRGRRSLAEIPVEILVLLFPILAILLFTVLQELLR